MFKSATIYAISPRDSLSPTTLGVALASMPFIACGPTQALSTGWVPPRGEVGGDLVESYNGCCLLTLMTEKKSVPSSALKAEVAAIAERIQTATGRKLSRRELKDLKDEAALTLLPRAFGRQAKFRVWLNPEAATVVIDAGSHGGADLVATQLLRVLPSGMSMVRLQSDCAAGARMSAWLMDADSMPPNFEIGDAVELIAPKVGGGKSKARFAAHSLSDPNVVAHLASGKVPARLALTWSGRLSFVIDTTLRMKAFKRLDAANVQASNSDSGKDEFDADLALLSGDLTALVSEIGDAFSGVETRLEELGHDAIFANTHPKIRLNVAGLAASESLAA